ncbi:MAG: NAD(P)/FAD-dependent oxidoreductase, partial [Bacteroidia bacterium]|nr:NAD(P)/FAD-dependent oxidoreductase [Bacteroidia bacterium]
RRAIEAVWYTGKLMGPVLAKTLTGNPTPYQQATWFNSAKFMDIEWQTYGNLTNKPGPGEKHIFWEHEDGTKLIRISYQAESGAVLGFNTMGIRYRSEVCIKWIEDGAHIEQVLQQLSLANFDPEFYRLYEQQLVNRYNELEGTALVLKKSRSLKKVFAFLGG